VADIFVLDTHVVIWYFIGSKRLRSVLKDKIDETRKSDGRLLVPTIVLVEALDVAEKGRVKFDFTEMYRLIREEPEFGIVSFTAEILDEAIHVQDVPELHDRIIVAPARYYGACILTKDRIILQSGQIQSL